VFSLVSSQPVVSSLRRQSGPLSEPESSEETEVRADTTRDQAQLSRTCQYCGQKVAAGTEAEHVRANHRQLTFSCRLCREDTREDTRYLYFNIRDVLTHQRLHHGTANQQEVEMAGRRSDLGGLAWVECKHCRYRGVGLGRETLSHTSQHQGASIEDFTIFCRLCHSHKDADEKVLDVLENREDFEDHVRQIHQDIIDCMNP